MIQNSWWSSAVVHLSFSVYHQVNNGEHITWVLRWCLCSGHGSHKHSKQDPIPVWHLTNVWTKGRRWHGRTWWTCPRSRRTWSITAEDGGRRCLAMAWPCRWNAPPPPFEHRRRWCSLDTQVPAYAKRGLSHEHVHGMLLAPAAVFPTATGSNLTPNSAHQTKPTVNKLILIVIIKLVWWPFWASIAKFGIPFATSDGKFG